MNCKQPISPEETYDPLTPETTIVAIRARAASAPGVRTRSRSAPIPRERLLCQHCDCTFKTRGLAIHIRKMQPQASRIPDAEETASDEGTKDDESYEEAQAE